MLSVIAVNHNSTALLRECLSSIVSILEDKPFEFLAVDSGSREEEAEALRSVEGGNVRLILSRENIGYARGVNAGIREARGDIILITNPDVVFKPGSIKSMITALSTLPRCGAVGPRTWWNKGMTFLLPMSELITPCSILKTEIMKTSHTLNNMILRSWVEKTSEYWLSEEPVMQEMLPGACIMTTRKVIESAGGFFDDSFPLYFEDTDWCLRLRKAGYRLYMVPGSSIVHYYNQSAKQDTEASREKFSASMDKYMEKHFRRYLPLLHAGRKLMERRRFPSVYEDMGPLAAPPHFTFRDDQNKLFLLSPVDSLIPSAGSFFVGTSFTIPEDLWGLLGEGRYFAKALKLHGFESCGAWSWEKANKLTKQ